jgi:hypothetical protein
MGTDIRNKDNKMIKDIKNNMVGSDFWLNSEELSFSEITRESRIPDRWRRFDMIDDRYKVLLLKPINTYVSELYPRPEIVFIDKISGRVTLRQKTHAEIWVSPSEENLYALDKTWQRQFYPSSKKYTKDNCFIATYKFYVPWVIDSDIKATVSSVDNSPFSVENQEINFNSLDGLTLVDTNFVDFKIKIEGSHMVNSKYGIIDIGTPMYDFSFILNYKQMERLVAQYG